MRARAAVSTLLDDDIIFFCMSQQYALSVDQIMPLFLQAWDLIERQEASVMNKKLIGYFYKEQTGKYKEHSKHTHVDRSFV